MVLGRLAAESTQYGRQDYTVAPIEGLELADQLHDAVKYIHGTYQEAEPPELGEGEAIGAAIPADPNVKNYSYTVVDGQVYYRENSLMVRPDLSAAAEARVRGMVSLRDCVQELIDLQMDPATPDSAIRDQQAELNRLYDAFTAKYGLHQQTGETRQAFSDDSSYYLLCSLEILDEDGNLRAQGRYVHPAHHPAPRRPWTMWTPQAKRWPCPSRKRRAWTWRIWSSLPAKRGTSWRPSFRGRSTVCRNPRETSPCYVTADEYLSGNVRSQAAVCADWPPNKTPAFQINVEALEAGHAQGPGRLRDRGAAGRDLDSDQRYIQQFML